MTIKHPERKYFSMSFSPFTERNGNKTKNGEINTGREIKRRKQKQLCKHLLKKYSAWTPSRSWTNIYPSNRAVCRWNSQLGSRAVMRGRERETICHCWVTLRSGERGLFSPSETHTHKPVLSLLIPDAHPVTYLHITYTHWDNTAGGKSRGYTFLQK